MAIELETLEALHSHLAAGRSLAGAVLQGIDLGPAGALLADVPVDGLVVLGCGLDAAHADDLRRRGALVFPEAPDLPFQPYRSSLYTPDELLEGMDEDDPETFFTESRDARIYAWYQASRARGRKVSAVDALWQRLHDHAVDDALADLLHGGAGETEVVAIMGGHAMRRDDPAYAEVAGIARALARDGCLLLSGGGPGAMEATHLGAWLARAEDAALPAALETLAAAPTYRDPGWLATARRVREAHPGGAASLGVPTWFYGHEPSTVFATHIAKYFSNSLREDGLLAVATHGVVYAPGSAGTVQEIFMDAAQNHYGTFGLVSPMVLFGVRYWTEVLPALPLLTALAGERQYARRILLTDDADEVVRFLERHPPVRYEPGG